MTPQAQRIAIAEVCGYKVGATENWLCMDLDGKRWLPREYARLPDYLSDLNAMHEAEKRRLTPDQCADYIGYLATCECPACAATAAQRAEAFLRTLNLWDDTK